jgi:hypothetical protein
LSTSIYGRRNLIFEVTGESNMFLGFPKFQNVRIARFCRWRREEEERQRLKCVTYTNQWTFGYTMLFLKKIMIAYSRVRARKTGNIERGLLRDFFGPQRRLNIAIVRSSFGNKLQRLTICRGEVDT